MEIILPRDIGKLMTLVTQPSLIEKIKEVQKEDPKLQKKADSVYHLGKFEGSCSLKPTISLIWYTLGVLKCTEISNKTFGGTG